MTTGESCKHFIFNVQDIIRACIQNDFYFPPVSLLSLYPQGRQVHPITGDYSSSLYCAYQLKLNPSKEISFLYFLNVKLPF